MSSVALSVAGAGQKADTAATANAVALRDANGGLTNNVETVTELVLNGAWQLKWNAQSASYAMTSPGVTGGGDLVVYVDATGGARTITLPSPTTVGAGQRVCVIKKDSSANTVTIAPNGAETINGASSKVLSAQYSVCWLFSDGTNWVASTTTS